MGDKLSQVAIEYTNVHLECIARENTRIRLEGELKEATAQASDLMSKKQELERRLVEIAKGRKDDHS